MACSCIEVVNAELASRNTQIHLPMFVVRGTPKPFVETIKLDDKKRGKPIAVFASYCPFCGIQYTPNRVPEGMS